MSILKSTNSGSQKLITLDYLFSRGWYHPMMDPFERSAFGIYVDPDGLDRRVICFGRDSNNLSVVHERDKITFFKTKYETHDYDGDSYEIEYYINPTTIADISLIERYFNEEDVLKKLLLEKEILFSDFTTTTASRKRSPFEDYLAMDNLHKFNGR